MSTWSSLVAMIFDTELLTPNYHISRDEPFTIEHMIVGDVFDCETVSIHYLKLSLHCHRVDK